MRSIIGLILIVFVLSFSVGCDSSKSSPAIFKTGLNQSNGNNDGSAVNKPQAPDEGKINVSVFSFENLGRNVRKDSNGNEVDYDKNKIEYLNISIANLVKDNDVLIFNNIYGLRGFDYFKKIMLKFKLNCISNKHKQSKDNQNKIWVCSNKYVKLEAPMTKNKDEAFAISGMEVPIENGDNLLVHPESGFHAIASIYDNSMSLKYQLNLVAVNLFKGNLDNVQSKQISALKNYIMDSNAFKDYPAIVVGDWQNDNLNILGEHLSQLNTVLSSGLKKLSPKGRTVMNANKIFNHLFYTSADLSGVPAFNRGSCSDNYSDIEKSTYRIEQSLYCPTLFSVDY